MNKIAKQARDEVKILQKRIAVLEELNAHYKAMEEKVDEARNFAENIVETVRQPLIIMDGDLKVISVNKAFYKTFRVHAKETQGKFIYDLGNGQWNIPKLRRLLKEIITKRNSLDDFEIQHRFENIGLKIMLLNARRIPPTPEKPRIILLSIEDITEPKKSQKEIASDLKSLEAAVVERTKQLDAVNEKLKEKISELEIFNKAAVGRELKMIDLKKEIEKMRMRIQKS